MDTAVIIAVCTTITTIIGIGVAFVQNKKLKAIGNATMPYLEALAAYEQGFSDKNLDDAELIAVGKKASAHFAALKEVFQP